MKKLVFTVCFLWLFNSVCFSQEAIPFGPRLGVGFVPQYTISGGLRFDIDRSISKTSNQWLIISPQVFMLTGRRFNHDFKDLWGVGMDVKHKIFLKPANMKPSGYYVQYGVMFQYFSINENR